MRIITHHDKVIIAPAVKKGAHFTSVMLSNINFHVTSQNFLLFHFLAHHQKFLHFLHLLLFFSYFLFRTIALETIIQTLILKIQRIIYFRLYKTKRLIFTGIYIQTFINYTIWKSHKYKNVAVTMKRKYLGILYHIDRNVWMKKSHLKVDNLS